MQFRRMLNASGNPTYRNLFGILRALNIEFGEVRLRTAARRGARLVTRQKGKARKKTVAQSIKVKKRA